LKKGDPRHHVTKPIEKEENMRPEKSTKRRARGWNKGERHDYYESNKEAIIADLLSTGRTATREKWNIPKGTLGKLMSRWLTKEQKAAIPISEPEAPVTTSESPHPSTNSTPSNGRLPPFPPFSDKWETEVQLQWLEVYSELATKEKSTVATTS